MNNLASILIFCLTLEIPFIMTIFLLFNHTQTVNGYLTHLSSANVLRALKSIGTKGERVGL